MRPLIIAAAAVTFVAGSFEAEARGGMRFRGGARYASVRPSAPAVGVAIVPAMSLRTGEASSADRTGSTVIARSVLSAEASPPTLDTAIPPVLADGLALEAAKVIKVAEPWCRSGRTVGAGSGFCLIN